MREGCVAVRSREDHDRMRESSLQVSHGFGTGCGNRGPAFRRDANHHHFVTCDTAILGLNRVVWMQAAPKGGSSVHKSLVAVSCAPSFTSDSLTMPVHRTSPKSLPDSSFSRYVPDVAALSTKQLDQRLACCKPLHSSIFGAYRCACDQVCSAVFGRRRAQLCPRLTECRH
jgi:hypothetical protein